MIALSEMCYWYRPAVDKDEDTGELLGYRKKFKADKLQKSYQSFSTVGLSKKQAFDACHFLKAKGLITLEVRDIEVAGDHYPNRLFIGIVPAKIAELNILPGGDTPLLGSNTPLPPSNTPLPPSNTPLPPSNTPLPPSNTPLPEGNYTENTPKDYAQTTGKLVAPTPSNQLNAPFNSPDEVLPEVQATAENRVQILDRRGIISSLRTEKDIFWLNKELNEMEAVGIDFQELDNFLEWWHRNDWRGMKLQKPTLKQIRENWLSYKNGNEQSSLAPIDITNTALDERGQRVLDFLQSRYNQPYDLYKKDYLRSTAAICAATKQGMEIKALQNFFKEKDSEGKVIELGFIGSNLAGWVALKNNKQAEGKR
jgi:hypothetical protein